MKTWWRSLYDSERRGKEAMPQWQFLHGEGAPPDHRQHDISDKDAQSIRIRLAGMK